MSAKVIPIRRAGVPAAKSLPAYPVPCDGVHLIADGDGWRLSRHAGGQSVSMCLTQSELMCLADMIDLATSTNRGAP
jgi:hypothetical protein